MATVPLTEKDVKKYLDDCIKFWRDQKKVDPILHEKAACYVDAFQSVRVSLFGDLLPKG